MPSVEKNKTPYSKSLMFLLACTSVFVYIASAVAFEITPETARISTIAIYAVFAVGLLFLLLKNNIILNEYSICIISFCVYVYLMCLTPNASTAMAMTYAYWLMTCVVVCMLIFFMVAKYPQIINIAMAAYILGALILSIRLISEYGGINELIKIASEEGENRIGGLMGNENGIGLFLANGTLCSLVFLFRKTPKTVKVLLILTMIVLITMLLLTGSRQSTAMVLIGFLTIVFFRFRKANISKKTAALFLTAIILIVAYNLITTLPMFSTINERFEKLFAGFFGDDTSYDTDMTRKYYISRGLEAFYEKPLFGHGTGYAYTLYGTYSHNNFVELLMNYGLVGFCLYYVPYTILAVKLFKQALKNDIIAIYFFTYTMLQIVIAVGWVNYYDRAAQIVTALAFGYLFIKKKEENGLNENKKFV